MLIRLILSVRSFMAVVIALVFLTVCVLEGVFISSAMGALDINHGVPIFEVVVSELWPTETLYAP